MVAGPVGGTPDRVAAISRVSAEVPAQQIQQLTGGAMAGEPFAQQGRHEAQHRHPAIEAFHRCQGGDVPGAAGRQSFAETLRGFIEVRAFRHDSRRHWQGAYGNGPVSAARTWRGLLQPTNNISVLVDCKLPLLLATTLALALHARLRLIPRLTEATLDALAWQIRGITALAIAFVVVGALIRLGGLA